MVLQREPASAVLWGYAPVAALGEQVVLTLDEKKYTTVAEKGISCVRSLNNQL